MKSGQPSLAIGGERVSGADVRKQNVTAVMSVANVVRSSLGPVGLDKMLVDGVGEVTISNDGATIMRLLEVEHPAAKILVELAQQQDDEVGDGTTSVVLIAAELLRKADELARKKLHPTTIIAGYRLACREACRFVEEQMSVQVSTLGEASLVNCAKTTLSSKILASDGPFFAQMAVDALNAVKATNVLGESRWPVRSVNILKCHGGSMGESQLIKGYALNCIMASQAMPKRVNNAKIAVLDMNLHKARMHLGVSMEITDPAKLEAMRAREAEIVLERIGKIIAAGANVILTTKGIDDLCLKPFVEAGAIGVRRCKKEDLVRIAKATGATMVSSLADLEGGESFDSSMLGHAEAVVQERFGDHECILILGTKANPAASIIMRGANELMLDEMERAMHDALSVVKRTLESGAVVPGGGAVETALSVYLENFATSIAAREQLAVSDFGDALLTIPKTLSVNAGKDCLDLLAKLRAMHFAAQAAPQGDVRTRDLKWTGLDLLSSTGNGVRDSIAAGVLEPAISKIKSLRSATEAAIAVLRIDDFITIKDSHEGHGHADGDECGA